MTTLAYETSSNFGTQETSVFTDYSTFGDLFTTVRSKDQETTTQQSQLKAYDILIPTFGTIIIILNLAVVISSGLILKKGYQPRSTYLFLGNVAMSDLITAIAIIFGQVFPKNLRNGAICSVQLGMIVSSTLASVYSVGLIAIDRYLYITHGLQYQTWVYPTRVRLLILITWIIGLIIGFLPAMGWAGHTKDGQICWFIRLAPGGLILLTCAIGAIPILVVIVLYSVILYHAIKKVVQLKRADTATAQGNVVHDNSGLRIFRGRTSTSDTSDGEETVRSNPSLLKRIFSRNKTKDAGSKTPSKWKAIKVVLFVTGSFVITWVPYFVASVIYVYCDEKVTPKKCKNISYLIASPLAILGFLNSLLNPIIYAWWHKGFRNFIKKLCSKRYRVAATSSSSSTKQTNSSNSRKTSTTTNEPAAHGSDLRMENIDLNVRY